MCRSYWHRWDWFHISSLHYFSFVFLLNCNLWLSTNLVTLTCLVHCGNHDLSIMICLCFEHYSCIYCFQNGKSSHVRNFSFFTSLWPFTAPERVYITFWPLLKSSQNSLSHVIFIWKHCLRRRKWRIQCRQNKIAKFSLHMTISRLFEGPTWNRRPQ